jgi:regulator of sirC expression with transglutaminase-like and TPR domain
MTKQQKKIVELNLIMDHALGGATAGLLALDSVIRRLDLKMASNSQIEALALILQQRHQLQEAIELLSRPVEQHKNGTLYYTGRNR